MTSDQVKAVLKSIIRTPLATRGFTLIDGMDSFPKPIGFCRITIMGEKSLTATPIRRLDKQTGNTFEDQLKKIIFDLDCYGEESYNALNDLNLIIQTDESIQIFQNNNIGFRKSEGPNNFSIKEANQITQKSTLTIELDYVQSIQTSSGYFDKVEINGELVQITEI